MSGSAILTNNGLLKIASASPLDQLTITQIAIGDGVNPLDPNSTALVNEVYRDAASTPIRSTTYPNTLVFELNIPPTTGGFTCREIGAFDTDGDLIAVGTLDELVKPTDGINYVARINVKLANAAQVDVFYDNQGAIDHSGLRNRDADNVHTANAIEGLEFDTVAEAIAYTKIDKLIGRRVWIGERGAYFKIVLTATAGLPVNGWDLIQSASDNLYSLKYYHESKRKLSFKAIGGKFDGVTGNDDVWARFLNLMKETGKSAALDSGIIRFALPNSLSSLASLETGFEFNGQGRFKTKFLFDYDNGYAYENAVGKGDKFPTFRNIGFYTRSVDSPNEIQESEVRAGFINLYSNGEEQGFRFDNCDIVGFNEVFRFEGTNNASETKMFGGSIKRCKDIFILNNEQALNHELHGTDVEQYFGSLVTIESGGGNGSVKMFGGSLIPFSPSVGVSHLFKTVGAVSSNLSRGPVVLNDVRTELRDDGTRICDLKGTSASLSLQFRGGVIFTNATQTTNIYISIDDRKKVTFDSVDFAGNTDANLQAFNYELVSTAQILNDPATLLFINSRISKDTASKITFTGGSGVAMAEKCSVAERVSVTNATASDFYRLASPRGSGRGGIQTKTFSVSPFSANNAAPTLTNEKLIDLPAGSRIIGMNVNHEAGGAADPNYNIVMTSSDGLTEYCRTSDYSYASGTYQEIKVTNSITSNAVRLTSDSGVLTTPVFSGYIDIIYK